MEYALQVGALLFFAGEKLTPHVETSDTIRYVNITTTSDAADTDASRSTAEQEFLLAPIQLTAAGKCYEITLNAFDEGNHFVKSAAIPGYCVERIAERLYVCLEEGMQFLYTPGGEEYKGVSLELGTELTMLGSYDGEEGTYAFVSYQNAQNRTVYGFIQSNTVNLVPYRIITPEDGAVLSDWRENGIRLVWDALPSATKYRIFIYGKSPNQRDRSDWFSVNIPVDSWDSTGSQIAYTIAPDVLLEQAVRPEDLSSSMRLTIQVSAQ